MILSSDNCRQEDKTLEFYGSELALKAIQSCFQSESVSLVVPNEKSYAA
jgi:hypothetical protein